MRKAFGNSKGFKPSLPLMLLGIGIATIIVVIAIKGRTAPITQAHASSAYIDSRMALASGTTPMVEVPSVLPPQGATINEQFILRPLQSAPASANQITAAQAIALGRTYANAHPFSASTLLTSFTSINSIAPTGATGNFHAIQNVPSWVVTFTNNNPQNVIQGKKGSPPDAPRHLNIVLNATTGAFVLGFFTE